ncbi:NRDE family protein [Geothrix paludis]|uniref:NRDE family protein n=1 Tax=Geothrix paludis TaxID=2922722 RepID=UPI001FAC3B1F|nr:NRDE family protein [Geothrix paludis]
MCLIALAYRAHPDFELVIAANRDEYHARPTAPAGPWEDAPEVFGGRDLSQGGSWLALSKRGRLACVTNVRRMVAPDPGAPSRGGLVASFVRGRQPARAFADELRERAMAFAGFNLLLWDGTDLRYLNNHPRFLSREVPPGVHVVSNADLDTPWPKTEKLRRAMTAWVVSGDGDEAPLLAALADPTPAADADLPDTGVGLELERKLSPAFIVDPTYGTRCTTIATLGRDGAVRFREWRFDPAGQLAGRTDTRWTAAPAGGRP